MKTTNDRAALPVPSPRDLQIYKGFVIFNRDQASIAMNLNISRARVAQVVKRVKRWLAAGGSPSDPEIREHLAQENLSHATKRIRLLRIIDRANYAAEHQLPSQKTTKTRYHGTTAVWHEETAVLAPAVNLPALRLLLNAVKTLDELETRDSPVRQSLAGRGSPDPALTEDQLLLSVFELLCRWRTKAEAAGHLPRVTNLRQLIAENLHALIGPLASGLSSSSPADHHSPSANISGAVSVLGANSIAPIPDQPITSDDALTSAEKKETPKC